MQLLNKIKEFHRENKQYEGFLSMEFFGFITAYTLAHNVFTLSTDVFDWCLFIIQLEGLMIFTMQWIDNKKLHEAFEICHELLADARKREDETYEWYEQEHARLIAANRRRKRAERKLKKTRLSLSKESAERFVFELQCDEYESVLLDANLAMADLSSCPILPDVKAMAEAQQRFKEYMKIHYAEIVKRQLNRQLKESAFGCLFFGDANGDPKDVYAGVFCGEESPFNPSNEIKENQEQ